MRCERRFDEGALTVRDVQCGVMSAALLLAL